MILYFLTIISVNGEIHYTYIEMQRLIFVIMHTFVLVKKHHLEYIIINF